MDAAPEKPEFSEPEGPPRHGGGGFGFLWALLALLVLYPLSIGPAARLHKSHPGAQRAIEATYKPLTILADKSPGFGRCIYWYVVNVWRLNVAPASAPAPSATTYTNSAPTSAK